MVRTALQANARHPTTNTLSLGRAQGSRHRLVRQPQVRLEDAVFGYGAPLGSEPALQDPAVGGRQVDVQGSGGGTLSNMSVSARAMTREKGPAVPRRAPSRGT